MQYRKSSFGVGAVAAVVVLSTPASNASADVGRVLTHEAIVHAPVADVWRHFTTDEGAQRWMAPKVKVDLRVGGAVRASYHPESTLEDEHTIVNRILAYEPERMLALRNEQAPAGFPWVEMFQETWSVNYFEALDERRTRLRVVGMGYGEGPEWDQLRAFFEQGNQQLIDVLTCLFATPDPMADERTLATLHKLVGGEWFHRSEDGAFRSSSIVDVGADGKSLTSRGWLGDAAGMRDHGRTLIYRAPSSEGGGVSFINVDERGSVTRGAIRLIADGHLEWDWPLTSLTGATRAFRAETRFEGDDAYTFTLSTRETDGSWTAGHPMRFSRRERATGSAPAEQGQDR